MESKKTLIYWWAWPAQQQPVRSFFAAVILLSSLFFCAQWDFFLTLCLGIVLLSTLSEILLPTFYQLQPTQLCVYALHMHRRVLWSDITIIKTKEHGFLLDIKTTRSRRKNLFLYCNSNKEKIGWILEQKISEKQT